MDKLDLIGFSLTFYHKGGKFYKTSLGGLVTLIIFLFSLIVFVLFGKSMFEKTNPQSIVSQKYQVSTIIDFRYYAFSISVFDSYGAFIDNPFMYFTFDYTQYKVENSNVIYISSDNAGNQLVYCQDYHYDSWKDKINDTYYLNLKNNNQTMCVDYNSNNTFIHNSLDNPTNTDLELTISLCDTLTSKCPDDLSKVQGGFVQINLLNSYVDPLDYKDPVKYYLSSIFQQISPNKTKISYVNIYNSTFVSDNGWIFQDSHSSNYVEFSYVHDDATGTRDPLVISVFTFSSPNIIHYISRKYLKVQELFAEIGGIINFLLVGAKVFLILFNEFQLFKEIFMDKILHKLIIDSNFSKVLYTTTKLIKVTKKEKENMNVVNISKNKLKIEQLDNIEINANRINIHSNDKNGLSCDIDTEVKEYLLSEFTFFNFVLYRLGIKKKSLVGINQCFSLIEQQFEIFPYLQRCASKLYNHYKSIG